MLKTNRLDTIATRQRKFRVRDVLFALCVAGAAALAMTSVANAADAASPSHVTTR